MCKLVFLALSVIFLSSKKGQANYFMSVMIMVLSCLFVCLLGCVLFCHCFLCVCLCVCLCVFVVVVVVCVFLCVCVFGCFVVVVVLGRGQHLWSWLFCLMTTLPEYQFHWPLSVPWGLFLAASCRRCWKCPPHPSPSSVASSGPAQWTFPIAQHPHWTTKHGNMRLTTKSAFSINQSIFYFMSVHIEVILDKNKKQKHIIIIIIYTNFPTGLWTIDLTILAITSILYKISLILL